MVVIVALVVLGVIFTVGALLGVSVAQNQAGDRERRHQRDRRISALRYEALVGQR
jgi:hypothetical protein